MQSNRPIERCHDPGCDLGTATHACCAQLLGWTALGLFLCATAVASSGSGSETIKTICGEHDMCLKILGLLCAGIFVAAAMLLRLGVDRDTGEGAVPGAGVQFGAPDAP